MISQLCVPSKVQQCSRGDAAHFQIPPRPNHKTALKPTTDACTQSLAASYLDAIALLLPPSPCSSSPLLLAPATSSLLLARGRRPGGFSAALLADVSSSVFLSSGGPSAVLPACCRCAPFVFMLPPLPGCTGTHARTSACAHTRTHIVQRMLQCAGLCTLWRRCGVRVHRSC